MMDTFTRPGRVSFVPLLFGIAVLVLAIVVWTDSRGEESRSNRDVIVATALGFVGVVLVIVALSQL